MVIISYGHMYTRTIIHRYIPNVWIISTHQIPYTVNPQNFFHDISVFYLFTVYFQVLHQKKHYGTIVLYFHIFYFHFFPYPRKLNDNEKM